MPDSLTIFGTEYTGVAGFKAQDGNSNTLAYIRPQGNKAITQNGNNIDVAEYSTVSVNVSGGGSPTLQDKTNIDPTESSQTITADTGYDGLNSVQINAISSSYVGSGIDRRDSTDLTASGATVSVPAGYYASAGSKAVASGTEGTPTATKGTVSSNSVTVTPSVTNTAGYISGGTHTGTDVTVSASELVSGTLTISSSGTKDVTNYASASVAAGSATTPATTVTANPSISVNSSTGLITATASATKSVTPTVSAGYVSSGTAGTITVSGSNTSQLTVQAAQTIHPSTSDQTITSGKYLTGTQTIKAVTTTNLSAGNILSGVTVKVGDSTDDDCVASVAGSVTFQTYYTGSSAPSSSLGVNGDIYLQTS